MGWGTFPLTWMTSSARSLQRWALGWRWSPSGMPQGLSLLGTGLVSLIFSPSFRSIVHGKATSFGGVHRWSWLCYGLVEVIQPKPVRLSALEVRNHHIDWSSNSLFCFSSILNLFFNPAFWSPVGRILFYVWRKSSVEHMIYPSNYNLIFIYLFH